MTALCLYVHAAYIWLIILVTFKIEPPTLIKGRNSYNNTINKTAIIMKTLRLRVHASNISIIIMLSDCSKRRKKRRPLKKRKKKSSLRVEHRTNNLTAKMAWSPESNPGYILERRALSLLNHICSPKPKVDQKSEFFSFS